MLTQPNLIPMPFANGGDANTIPETQPTPSTTSAASWTSGFPVINSTPLAAGGIPPAREDFNGAFKALSEHTVWGQSGNLYDWSALLDYAIGAHTKGSNSHEYIAVAVSGPNTANDAQDPTTNSGAYWFDLTHALNYPKTAYELCEVYYFLNPALRPGFVEAAGGLVNNAATLYPAAFGYLQTVEGSALCVTEAQWQAMSTATYYTDASGNTEGWNGVGGVPKFVLDTGNGTIRVPDLRGMYMEAAGLDSLAVGGVHADMIRNITGSLNATYRYDDFAPNGVFVGSTPSSAFDTGSYRPHDVVTMDVSRQIPTGNQAKPRAFGVLACVYLGE